jgi:hypothetical protein
MNRIHKCKVARGWPGGENAPFVKKLWRVHPAEFLEGTQIWQALMQLQELVQSYCLHPAALSDAREHYCIQVCALEDH